MKRRSNKINRERGKEKHFIKNKRKRFKNIKRKNELQKNYL